MKRIVASREYMRDGEKVMVISRKKKWITYGRASGNVVWACLKEIDGVECATFKDKILFRATDAVKAKCKISEPLYTITKIVNGMNADATEGTFEALRDLYEDYIQKTASLYTGKGISAFPRTIEKLVENLNKIGEIRYEKHTTFDREEFELSKS
jgi:hypothetical protein